jgi:hypothetical protein
MQTWNTEQIAAALAELRQPFPLDVVQVKLGATTEKDGKAIGLGLLYADWWTGYLPVLQRIIGPGNWQIELKPWGPNKVIAELTAFGGKITHWSSGEGDESDDNTGTSAEIQAKKRVCAEALGLGLYLYSAPKIWGDVTHKGRGATFLSGEEERIKQTAYQRMGIGLAEPAALVNTAPISRAPVAQPARRPSPDQLSRARAALAEAERRTANKAPARGANNATSVRTVLLNGAMADQILALIEKIKAIPNGTAGVDDIGNSLGFLNLPDISKAELLNGKLSRDDGEEILGSLRDLQSRLQRKARAS